MDSGKPYEKIIQAIERIWEKGIVLSKDALSFLESIFGISTAQELEKALDTEDFPEKEMMFEYLLFPDLEILLALEALLEPGGLATEAADEIAKQLTQNHSRLNLFHPENPNPLAIRIPADQMETFISRLNLTRNIDHDICKALEDSAAASDALSFRVLLRSKNYRFNEEKKQFILEFIQRSENRALEFVQVFELFLDLLSQAPDSADLESFFLDRQQWEKIMLERIQKFEEKREYYNMEYLILSKYPVPSESFETVTQRLEKLNIITGDILCVPPRQVFNPPMQDIGNFDPKKDMKRLLRILS